jgi:hypothetical protein
LKEQLNEDTIHTQHTDNNEGRSDLINKSASKSGKGDSFEAKQVEAIRILDGLEKKYM